MTESVAKSARAASDYENYAEPIDAGNGTAGQDFTAGAPSHPGFSSGNSYDDGGGLDDYGNLNVEVADYYGETIELAGAQSGSESSAQASHEIKTAEAQMPTGDITHNGLNNTSVRRTDDPQDESRKRITKAIDYLENSGWNKDGRRQEWIEMMREKHGKGLITIADVVKDRERAGGHYDEKTGHITLKSQAASSLNIARSLVHEMRHAYDHEVLGTYLKRNNFEREWRAKGEEDTFMHSIGYSESYGHSVKEVCKLYGLNYEVVRKIYETHFGSNFDFEKLRSDIYE